MNFLLAERATTSAVSPQNSVRYRISFSVGRKTGPETFPVENMGRARQLMLAGVPTELHIYPHAVYLIETAHVVRAYIHDSMFALKRAVGD
ncbi:hypothetical protein [Burkholderia cenocepacia]|uniref:hypothetical protein n=1 Tax=Burkholderia cenocepacia TaxID=95486 RepID=UPI002866E3D6|nr:hypothetical protein [Burkholderia cenocepacia]MDR8071902.1 hypothetical protein [Burkholderia cenocepacia]